LDIAGRAPFDPQYEYYLKTENLIKAADLCIKEKKPDLLVKLFEKAKKTNKKEEMEYISRLYSK
jgi:hypothetical protein